MLIKTNHTVSIELIERALNIVSEDIVINEPTNDFFYDSWVIKPEYKGTIWDTLLSSLDEPDIGQARVIILPPGEVYQAHADLDNRWHLNLLGEQSYLIDLDHQHMYKLSRDGIWYLMNTERIHTACNFGPVPRIQLVVRKLLEHGNIQDRITVSIKPSTDFASNEKFHSDTSYRYLFDQTFSPWLNHANQNRLLDNFKIDGASVMFDTDISQIEYLKQLTPDNLLLSTDINAR